MLNTMWVVPVEPGRVALWERHSDHPGGELLIVWDGNDMNAEPDPQEVVATPGVMHALLLDKLRRVLPPHMEIELEDVEEADMKTLSNVKGIGVIRARELYALGITDVHKLAGLTDAEMLEMAGDAGFSLTQLQGWQRAAVSKLRG